MVTLAEYESHYENKWCPGCGNFGILQAMKKALVALNIAPHEILVVSGIGQAAKTPHFLRCNGFHGLHGRALPVATGAKIANHALNILVNMGDGDCYSEGGNHFLHAIRRNIDLTALVHDNRVFGLTKGQASPTAEVGTVTRAQPFGVISEPFNPLTVALALDAGFVARGFSGNADHLSGLIQAGMKHRGFSLIDILQPCVSFNHVNTHKWYAERVYTLESEGYSPTDLHRAIDKAQEWGSRIPIGILYQKEKLSFTDQFPSLAAGPLLQRSYDAGRVKDLLEGLR
jgi:2-oxoglutarate/2-oxoacid ferredoxin oxidoreductase subunit beta